MVFYNKLLLKIESSKYCCTGSMYHAKEIPRYNSVSVFLHTPTVSCTSSDFALYFFEVSSKYLKWFSSYRENTKLPLLNFKGE